MKNGLALLVGLTLLAAACNGGDGDGDASGQADDQPQELVVAADADSYTVEEPGADVGFTPRSIFEGLVAMSPEYEVVPVLATSWELREPNTWRFELREDVSFHDGTPFTAEAVKYTFDRKAETGGGTAQLGPDSTVIVDDFTVDVTPKVENLRLVEQLVHPTYSIIAPGSMPGEQAVGTGPFSFLSYEPEQQLVVERNDGYWGDEAALDRITFRFIPDSNARRLALESGDVDVMLGVPLDAVGSLQSGGTQVDVPAPGLYEAMYANISGEAGYTILQDENVRKAVATAIDREALVEGVFDGLAEAEQTVIPARLLEPAGEVIEGYDYDLERAAELLEQSGWTPGPDGVRQKDGQRLSLELISGFPSSQQHGAVAEFIQAQLGEVGVEVEVISTPDTASYQARLNAFQGDLWLERGSQNDANPTFLPALLFWEEGTSGNIGYQPVFAPGWPPGPEARIGTEYDQTVVRALAAETTEQAKELSAEAMHILIDELAIVIPLAELVAPVAATEEVEGLEAHPSAIQMTWADVSISE